MGARGHGLRGGGEFPRLAGGHAGIGAKNESGRGDDRFAAMVRGACFGRCGPLWRPAQEAVFGLAAGLARMR